MCPTVTASLPKHNSVVGDSQRKAAPTEVCHQTAAEDRQ